MCQGRIERKGLETKVIVTGMQGVRSPLGASAQGTTHAALPKTVPSY
jgi:hypothetical protein